MSTPATAASAPPAAQLTMAMRSGEYPSAAAAIGFSADASVAWPNLVQRNTAARTAVTTMAMRMSQSRSSLTVLPVPKRSRGVSGSGERTGVPWSPQTSLATARARKNSANVATTRTRDEACRRRAITRRWTRTPSAAGTAMARTQAASGDQPRSPVAR